MKGNDCEGIKIGPGRLGSQPPASHVHSPITVILLSQDQSAAASFNTGKAQSETLTLNSSCWPSTNCLHAEAKWPESRETGKAHL